jgi:hypothetical protein
MDLWMTAPAEDALKLQRPLADGALMIVARGEKTDEGSDLCGAALRCLQSGLASDS